MSEEADPVTDADLVAYLDGELAESERRALETRIGGDAGLAARLDVLARGGRPFDQAYDLLLRHAPAGRLEAMLAGIIARTTARPAAGHRPPDLRLARIAAGLLLFLAGGAAGVGLPALLPGMMGSAETEASEGGWRAVVAEYLTLYTSDTLAGIPDDMGLRAQELAAVANKLALDLTLDKVALPGLSLKRSQLFSLDGEPLAQIAYLSPRDGPVALCVIADGAGEEAQRFEQRQGRNIVYWSKAGHDFMLIGKTPRLELEKLAALLADRLT